MLEARLEVREGVTAAVCLLLSARIRLSEINNGFCGPRSAAKPPFGQPDCSG
jgi:hypothetical protein